jgi:hypothetical protein
VYKVVDLGPGVFQNARNETMLLFFEAGPAKDAAEVEIVRTTPRVFPKFSERSELSWSFWMRVDRVVPLR